MSYLFPINNMDPIDSAKAKKVEKIADEDSKNFSSQHHEQEQEKLDELEKKINKLANSKKLAKVLASLDIDNSSSLKLLNIAKDMANNFLKVELLKIAQDVLHSSIEAEQLIEYENIDSAEGLAKFIIKLAQKHNKTSLVKNKVDKLKALEDKNAGFLVHYCKDILEAKQGDGKVFTSKRLLRQEINKIFNSKDQSQ